MKERLDECVTDNVRQVDSTDRDDDPRYGIRIDYGPLLGHKRGVVKEILSLGHKKAQIVLNHPVMETYLQVKLTLDTRFLFLISAIISVAD